MSSKARSAVQQYGPTPMKMHHPVRVSRRNSLGRKDQEWLMQTTRLTYALPGWKRSAMGCSRLRSPCWCWSCQYHRALRSTCSVRFSVNGLPTSDTSSVSRRLERSGSATTRSPNYLHSASTTFLRLNLALLLVVSFLPFPTKLLAENLRSRDGERVAATIYGVTPLGAMLLLWLLWLLAVRTKFSLTPNAHGLYDMAGNVWTGQLTGTPTGMVLR
jgi:hypothetical protein